MKLTNGLDGQFDQLTADQTPVAREQWAIYQIFILNNMLACAHHIVRDSLHSLDFKPKPTRDFWILSDMKFLRIIII